MTIRRALGATIAAVGLAVVPAMGAVAAEGPYNDTDELVVTDGNPEEGEPFNAVVEAGPESGENTLTVTSQDPSIGDDQIEIAGSQSMTKAATGGTANFTVTLYAEGRYTMTGFDESGEQVGQAVVVVGDGETGDGDSDSDGTAGGAAGSGSGSGFGLPDTGAEAGTALLAGGGLVLVVAGGTLLYVRRRNTGGAAA